jgi:hypothetical protein
MNRSLTRFLVFGLLGSLAVAGASAAALSANTAGAAENPLQGISAAAQAPTGVSDASAHMELTSLEARVSGPLADQVIDQARLLPVAVSGMSLYVIPSTNGDLCVFLEQNSESCTSPLTDSHPATFSVVDLDGSGGEGPIVFGVAEDGISAISFSVAGETETVAVHDNVFSYQAAANVTDGAITDPTAALESGEMVGLG